MTTDGASNAQGGGGGSLFPFQVAGCPPMLLFEYFDPPKSLFGPSRFDPPTLLLTLDPKSFLGYRRLIQEVVEAAGGKADYSVCLTHSLHLIFKAALGLAGIQPAVEVCALLPNTRVRAHTHSLTHTHTHTRARARAHTKLRAGLVRPCVSSRSPSSPVSNSEMPFCRKSRTRR